MQFREVTWELPLIMRSRDMVFKVLFVVVCVISFSVSKATAQNQKIPAILAFGDSILDTGNNNKLLSTTKANFPPYGKDFPGGIPTGRFGNGKVFSDLMAEGLAIKETVPAFGDPNLRNKAPSTGLCFASAGSGVDEWTARIQNVIPLSEQLNNLKKYLGKLRGAAGVNTIISEALFLISAGNNDIAIGYYSSPFSLRALQYDIDAYTSLLVSQLTSFVKDLYGLGGRKFGFLSTLPLGCLPAVRTIGGGPLRQCYEAVNKGAQMFNSKLATQLSNLQSNLTGAKLVFLDVYNPLLKLIQNPRESGFVNADRACCGTGLLEASFFCNRYNPLTCGNASSYVFWDAAHPSERAYRVIISEILEKFRSDLQE